MIKAYFLNSKINILNRGIVALTRGRIAVASLHTLRERGADRKHRKSYVFHLPMWFIFFLFRTRNETLNNSSSIFSEQKFPF